MHKQPKAIVLNRETLRRLDPRELNRIAGGFSVSPCHTGAVTKCGDQCVTYSCGPIKCF